VASFFLIQTDPGYADAVADVVASLPGVVNVAVTTGPYDVVAEVTPALEQQDRIRAEVRRAPGLCRLCVCQGSRKERRAAS
jgi:hypothetical protein